MSERTYVRRQACGQEWNKVYRAGTLEPTFTNRWGSASFTMSAIKALVHKTKMVNSFDPYYEDVVQEVALAVWNRGAKVEHAVAEALRKHGPVNRAGHHRLEHDALRLDYPLATDDGEYGGTVGDTVGSADPNLERIVADEPTLQRIKRVLNEREQFVVIGVLGGVQNKELGEQLGVTESRVSRMFSVARGKLFRDTRPRNHPKTWTNEMVVLALKEWEQGHGRVPKQSDLVGDTIPSIWSIRKTFGTLNKALAAAGYPKENT